jgi:hypothetical protein
MEGRAKWELVLVGELVLVDAADSWISLAHHHQGQPPATVPFLRRAQQEVVQLVVVLFLRQAQHEAISVLVALHPQAVLVALRPQAVAALPTVVVMLVVKDCQEGIYTTLKMDIKKMKMKSKS